MINILDISTQVLLGFGFVFIFLQYVLSGSDDFRLYMWKIPEDLSSSKFSFYNHYDMQYFVPFNNQIVKIRNKSGYH